MSRLFEYLVARSVRQLADAGQATIWPVSSVRPRLPGRFEVPVGAIAPLTQDGETEPTPRSSPAASVVVEDDEGSTAPPGEGQHPAARMMRLPDEPPQAPRTDSSRPERRMLQRGAPEPQHAAASVAPPPGPGEASIQSVPPPRDRAAQGQEGAPFAPSTGRAERPAPEAPPRAEERERSAKQAVPADRPLTVPVPSARIFESPVTPPLDVRPRLEDRGEANGTPGRRAPATDLEQRESAQLSILSPLAHARDAPAMPRVQVSIGRVEVRAVYTTPTPDPPRTPRSPLMSLDEYLGQREGHT